MEKESQKVKKVNLQELRKETNDYEVWDEEKQVWCDYKSSCYSVVVRQAGFPTPDKAQHPILSIACKVLGSRDPFVVFGTRVNTKDEYFNYIHCDSEEKMLQAFQTYWVSEVNPDIVTGWNCIPVAESIWLNDRIAKLKDVAPKQHLVDSFVHHVFPRSIKPTATIRLKNGHQFFCSKEHRFPIATLPARTYTDPVNSNFIRDDLSAEAIKTLLSTNSVYLRQEIHKNTAEPLTYRRLIVDNLDLLCSKGMEIVIRDNEIVKKMTAATGEPCWEKKRHTEWTVGRVSSALSRKEVIRFIKRSATLDVYAPEIGRSLKTVDLDSVISLDDLWTMGLWYTDGTQSYKTEVSICNKDERIAEKTKDILNKYRRTSTKTIKRHSDGCYYIKAGLTNVWFWKLFFYENVKSCSQKQIDVTLLSQLDKQQFMAFMAGCIDGDGSVSKTGLISLVNYNNDIRHFSELLNWNGIFTTIFASGKTLTFYDDSIENFLIHPVKKTNAQSSKGSMRERSSKSNCLAWNINDDHAWVRVESVDLEGDLAEMVDISTDTHYFVSQGIRTHNCEQFDIPYIINRCNKVMGEEFTKKFSPFNGIIKNPITSHIPHSKKKKSGEEKEKDLIYEITGITVVDYLPLYKKYSMATLESYRLDVVAKHELGMGKVDYSQYDGLMGLYEKNFELFLYYNYMDVKIIEDLESKLNFLFLVATVTYLGKSKYEDAFGVVKWWDTYIYNELLKKNVQIPPHRRRGIDDTKIVGGFVKEPVPKMYSWIATLDLASLYPSIIMSFNLSPEKAYKSAIYDLNEIESLVDMKNDLTWIRDADVAMLANGATFRRDGQGILPELVDGMFSSRKEFKKQSIKIAKELEEIEGEIAKLENHK